MPEIFLFIPETKNATLTPGRVLPWTWRKELTFDKNHGKSGELKKPKDTKDTKFVSLSLHFSWG